MGLDPVPPIDVDVLTDVQVLQEICSLKDGQYFCKSFLEIDKSLGGIRNARQYLKEEVKKQSLAKSKESKKIKDLYSNIFGPQCK